MPLIRYLDVSTVSRANPHCFVTSRKASKTSSIGELIIPHSGRTSGAAHAIRVTSDVTVKAPIKSFDIMVYVGPRVIIRCDRLYNHNLPLREGQGKSGVASPALGSARRRVHLRDPPWEKEQIKLLTGRSKHFTIERSDRRKGEVQP